MTGIPAIAVLQTADGMGSAVIFMIVDVEDAGSGPGSVPRASVMVRDESLCFLNLSTFLGMVFISLSEAWKRGNKVAGRKKFSITLAHQRFNSDQSPIHPFLCLSNNSDDYHHPICLFFFLIFYN